MEILGPLHPDVKEYMKTNHRSHIDKLEDIPKPMTNTSTSITNIINIIIIIMFIMVIIHFIVHVRYMTRKNMNIKKK